MITDKSTVCALEKIKSSVNSASANSFEKLGSWLVAFTASKGHDLLLTELVKQNGKFSSSLLITRDFLVLFFQCKATPTGFDSIPWNTGLVYWFNCLKARGCLSLGKTES